MRLPQHDRQTRRSARQAVLERVLELEEEAEGLDEAGNPGRAASLRWTAAAARTAIGPRTAAAS